MKWIDAGDGRAVKILRRTELNRDAEYRLCDYTFLFSEKGIHLIRQTLTGQIALLNDVEWAALEQFRTGLQKYAFIEENGLAELVYSQVLVEKDWDDLSQYELLIRVLRSMSREKPGVKNYTILPTTSCNARCIYCFEEGLPVETMTRETADRLVEYIAATRWEDTITLEWFGGEPLCASKTISHICRQLKKRNIPFHSQITTNGTLMTSTLAEEAKTVWHLTYAQISMDGAREDYEKRKCFPNPDGTEYDRALTAAEHLLDLGIRVVIRINFDRENYPRLPGFFDEINRRFSGRQGLLIDPAPLTQTRYSDGLLPIYGMREELFRYLDELKLTHGKPEDKPFHVRLNQCMADSMGKQVVIDPEGTVFNCDSLPGPAPVGTIFHNDVRAVGPDSFETVAEECRHCCFLPKCTPHFRTGCPLWSEGCFDLVTLIEKTRLRRLFAGKITET